MPARVRVRESVVQSVAQHTVIEHAITHAVAPTASRNEIRRLVHVLHASRHRDIDIAEGDLLRSGDDGLRSRAADPINGECWSGDRKPGVDASLSGGIHLGASLDDVAHDNRFHIIGANVRARDRSGDCYRTKSRSRNVLERASKGADRRPNRLGEDRKSTRLNSSHLGISYAVFCLKKKKKTTTNKSEETTPTNTLPHDKTMSRHHLHTHATHKNANKASSIPL